MDALLLWQLNQVLITLMFEGIGTLFLVHTLFEITAVPGITCYYGYFGNRNMCLYVLFEDIGTSVFSKQVSLKANKILATMERSFKYSIIRLVSYLLVNAIILS